MDNVDTKSIVPLIATNETQIILQRHCAYNRAKGELIEESINIQKSVVENFIEKLKQNTYFLFTASNTIANTNFKRCVETTNIAMNLIEKFLKENQINTNHIMNLNEISNYKKKVHEDKLLTEPKMFTDNTGFLEFLKEKHNGINPEFWIDFENDDSKEVREELNAEGPDEIVDRGVKYVNLLQKYAECFHRKNPKSKLIIWNGTHYDLISPLVKQRILFLPKETSLNVSYCGGISLIIDKENKIKANMNGIMYPIDVQYNLPLHRHF